MIEEHELVKYENTIKILKHKTRNILLIYFL